MKPRKKKRRSTSKSQTPVKVLVIVGALLLVFFFGYTAWLYNNTRFVRYPAFGISLPARYTIHGIDVSHHQGRINWMEVSSMKSDDVQIEYAFIKATEGLKNIDRQFRRNWREARQAGVSRGAYHFFIAPKSGVEQAKHFIRQVEILKGDLPPVLDVEELYGASIPDLRKNVKDWLQTVEAHYHVKPIIYTNADFYSRYLGEEFNEYPLWVAHYLQPEQPRVQRGWQFWQHNEDGRVNGIRESVDFNVFYGDSREFKKLLVDY
jgi:lysozyme